MTILLQAHARPLIVSEFAVWAKGYPRAGRYSISDGHRFFEHLKSQKPELLEFRFPGHDQWPIVEKWLIDAGLIAP